ncbi:MAG: CotH kinase family protein [Lentimicrobiaceae bacterium]|nr:CotH kinase family protein [Lentimicrobiaceae bacterium]
MKKNVLLVLLFACFQLQLSVKAQPILPDNGELYIHSVVPRVDILIHPDTLAWIYENVESDQEFHATFVYDNNHIHDTIYNIGFRLRGNTSRYAQKKSFKVSFNSFIQGQKYFGVEKMNLNGEHNDPSVVRAGLYWEILREAHLAGPRANHVRVYINGNFYGVYTNVEHIDEEFAKTYFGNNDGNLYKCLWPADLGYRGSNPDDYKFMAGDRRTYELKINEEADDYSDLANFISVLNNTPLVDLPCELEKVFNVQDYLKIAAIDILTGNWDGYIYNKNNFYLYHNTATGLFEYIPYDTDNTFGIDWFGIDWASRNIYNWSNPDENRPLYTRLMQVPEYRDAFTYYTRQIIGQITSLAEFQNNITALKSQLEAYVAIDPYYPLDYGYTINSFNTSFTSGTGAHVPIGLLPFINSRNASALSQAENTQALPIVKYIGHNSPLAFQNITIKAFAEATALSGVEVEYRLNGAAWQQIPMHDDGTNGDTEANDNYFTANIDGMPGNTLLEFSIKAIDNQQIQNSKPCSPVQYTIPSTNSYNIYINEFMASNNSTIADENGEFDDWIELYNNGNQTIWLGDKYLTDNLSNPQKWALPDTNLAAGAYLLVWADGQPEQGALHTNYKLDKDAEEIGLFDNEENGFALLDGVTYTTQSTDISMGRVNDASPEWKFFNQPTPGSTNSMVGIDEISLYTLKFWPNPVSTGILYFSEKETFSIYNIQGQELMHFNHCNQASVAKLHKGMYLIRCEDGRSGRFIIN